MDYIVQNTLGVLLNGRADRPDPPTSPPEAEFTARRAATPYLTLDAQISATDRQTDRLVYELYGLTEE